MATFTKLDFGSWRVQVRWKGIYVNDTFPRRKDAEEWTLEVERRIDRGEPAIARNSRDAKTFGDLIKLHREDLQEVGKRIGRSKGVSLTFLEHGLALQSLFNRLYLPGRKPSPIIEALCWSDARREFFELADVAAKARRGGQAAPISPIALEAVKRVGAIFDIERDINGLPAEQRLRARREHGAKLSRRAEVAKAIDSMLTRWSAFARFLEDGRICLTNNAAERALRGIALGRKSWLFADQRPGPSGPPSCTG